MTRRDENETPGKVHGNTPMKTLCLHCSEPLWTIEREAWCTWYWDEKEATFKTYETTDLADYSSGRVRCANCRRLLSEEFLKKLGLYDAIFG